MQTPALSIEIASRHQAHIERLKSGDVSEYRSLFEAMERDILGRLAGGVTEWNRARLETQLEAIQEAMRAQYTGPMLDKWRDQLGQLASYEAGFESKALSQVAPAYNFTLPSDTQLVSAVFSQPLMVRGPDGGKLLEPFYRDWTEAGTNQVVGAIRRGFAEGQTTREIVNELRGFGGVFERNRRGFETLTRTALQHAAVTAREQTWQANSDIVKGVRWVSTLDTRTSTICQSLDTQIFPVNEGPRPPAHPSCRSSTVAVLDERFDLLEEGGTRRERDPITGKVEFTSAKTSYYQWLKSQPAAVQDSIIGPTRGKLLRNGGLSAQRFAELQLGRNFQPLNLSQMKELDPVAFSRAFPEAPTRPAFKYESFAPIKKVAEADAFIVANGIADAADLKGLSIEGINKILPAAQEVVERFNLKPLAAFGPAARFNARTPRNAMAAVFSRFQATPNGNRGLFHAPTTLGKRANLLEQKRRADHWGDRYYDEAKARLDNSKAGRRVGKPIEDEVHVRFSKVDPSRIGHTVGSRGDIDSVTAITVYHEYGHVIHLVDDQIADKINAFIGRVMPERTGWDHLLSKYAGANSREYVAEAFAVYMGEPASQHFRIHPELLKIFQDADKKK